ncbi:MAG: hypothetical protein LBH56_01470 [Coriobacteriales bacterium]|jgi:predicted small lipoprotein YifL|nr:hypothetical protein [Coriobacteriales bacterium]
MRKKILVLLLTALTLFALAGTLVACGNEGTDTPPADENLNPREAELVPLEIVKVNTTQQTVANAIEMTNFQVVFKHSPEEWNALSSERKRELAQGAYDKMIEWINADGISNFHIQGVSSYDKDAGETAQMAFFMSYDESLLKIYTGTDGTGKGIVTDELPINLP